MADVAGIELVPVEHELTMPFAIAGGGMDTARAVIVRVELADGTIGLGEAAPFPAVSGETVASTIAALERHRDVGRRTALRRRAGRPLRAGAGAARRPPARGGTVGARLDAAGRLRRWRPTSRCPSVPSRTRWRSSRTPSGAASARSRSRSAAATSPPTWTSCARSTPRSPRSSCCSTATGPTTWTTSRELLRRLDRRCRSPCSSNRSRAHALGTRRRCRRRPTSSSASTSRCATSTMSRRSCSCRRCGPSTSRR